MLRSRSNVRIAGIPLKRYYDRFDIEWNVRLQSELEMKTKKMGANIIKRKEKTNYGIATCACEIVNSVINNKSAVFSVSSILHGKYGQNEVSLSVPSVIDAAGVSKTIEIPLNANELSLFFDSANVVRSLLSEYE